MSSTRSKVSFVNRSAWMWEDADANIYSFPIHIIGVVELQISKSGTEETSSVPLTELRMNADAVEALIGSLLSSLIKLREGP